MDNWIYPLSVIAVTGLVTFLLRAFPFLLFSGKPLPETMRYLGMALPPAIMTVLVIYCLRDTQFLQYPYGIPEIAASLLTIFLQYKRKNMYLSIIAGTFTYMILIRIF